MSERGRKIFTTVVWIVIFAGVIGYLTREIWHKESIPGSDNAKLTRQEWAEILAEDYGDESLKENVTDGDMEATGEYVVLAAFTAVGEDRITQILQQDGMEGDSLGFALSKGIVSEDQLDREVTEEEARKILSGIFEVDSSPEYYPDYFDVGKVTTILNGDDWNIRDVDKESNTLVATLTEVPEIGDAFTYTDEFGVAQLRIVESIEKVKDVEYRVHTEEATDISEILEYVSFSGHGDFGYLVGKESEEPTEQATIGNPFVLTAHAEEPTQLALSEWFEDKTAWKKKQEQDTPKCDIEIRTTIEDDKVTSYLKTAADGLSTTYKYDPSKKSPLSICTELEFQGVDIKGTVNKTENDSTSENNDDNWLMNDKFKTSISAGLNIKGLTVCSSGYFQFEDPMDRKNYVEILVRADSVSIDTTAKASHEFKQKIGSIPIPLLSGALALDLELYLVADVKGEIKVEYEITSPCIGAKVSTASGVKIINNKEDQSVTLSAKVELSAGIMGDAVMNVLGFRIADPGVDVRARATAKTLKVPSGYEYKTEYKNTTCYEVKAMFPEVKFSLSAGKDSWLNDLMEKKDIEVEYTLFPHKGEWWWSKTFHVEWDHGFPDMITMYDGYKMQDVCTHIRPKPTPTPKPTPKPTPTPTPKPTKTPKPSLEDRVNDKIDEKKKETQIKVEQTINDAIYNFLMENCNGCY